MSEKWLKGLNPEQRQAASHDQGPLLILAGAGSGKTTVLVHRTGRMIEDRLARADEILVLTFTNKAAKEFTQRVQTKVGTIAKNLWTGTFHSFGLSVLKKNYKLAGLPRSFGIIDQSDAISIVKDLLKTITHYDKSDFDPGKLLELIGKLRAGDTDWIETPEYKEMCEALLPAYLQRLNVMGVVDFDGLLLKPVELFENHPKLLEQYQKQFRFFMVDEFQDTNHNQMRLIRLLSNASQNLCVVGDDDQSIYGWRGAQIEHILHFARHYPSCETIYLTRNYRSKKSILNVANHLIKQNKSRHAKELVASGYKDQGDKPEMFIYDHDLEEVQGITKQIEYFQHQGYAYRDICLLYRSNSQGGMLEASLRKNQIPYSMTGGQGFFSRKEIKDIIGYLTCLVRPSEVTFRRILNAPSRGIGEKTIQTIGDHAEKQNISFFRASKNFNQLDLTTRAHAALETLHKGLHHHRKALFEGGHTPGQNLLIWLKELGYQKYVYESFKDAHTAHKRWELIETFARVLDGFFEKSGRTEKTLISFIEAMQLGDTVEDDDTDKSEVQLMTLHRCKGLEFKVVIIVGVEEDIIPHRNLGSDVSEERRLFYVGLTRAKERLVITRALKRKRHGKLRPVSPSRFLLEIPENMLTHYEQGYRPMGDQARKAMIQALYQRLDGS